MIEEPVENEGAHAPGVLPAAVQLSPHHRFEFGQGIEHLIAEPVLHRVPASCNRVQLRAVGGQGDDAHLVGPMDSPIPQMKTGASLDAHMQRGGIAAANLPVALPAMGLSHRFGAQELRTAHPHPHRAMNKAPLIFLLGGHARTVAGQAPDPPGQTLQPVAHLVPHPQPHRATWWPRQGGEFGRQFRAELKAGGGVLFDVAFARNPQPRARFPQPVIQAAQRQLHPVGLDPPPLQLGHTPPASGLQIFLQFGQRQTRACAGSSRVVAARARGFGL